MFLSLYSKSKQFIAMIEYNGKSNLFKSKTFYRFSDIRYSQLPTLEETQKKYINTFPHIHRKKAVLFTNYSAIHYNNTLNHLLNTTVNV